MGGVAAWWIGFEFEFGCFEFLFGAGEVLLVTDGGWI
jgi:hypothetical protein